MGLEQTAIESSPKVAARKGRTPMMGALLLARACHGDPLADEIAAEAPARLTTGGATRRLAPEARARRTKAKGGAR